MAAARNPVRATRLETMAAPSSLMGFAAFHPPQVHTLRDLAETQSDLGALQCLATANLWTGSLALAHDPEMQVCNYIYPQNNGPTLQTQQARQQHKSTHKCYVFHLHVL